MPETNEQQTAWVRKNAWSRERCENLRALAYLLDDPDDQDTVLEAAEFMLRARQAFRGGRLNVRGSRHWKDN